MKTAGILAVAVVAFVMSADVGSLLRGDAAKAEAQQSIAHRLPGVEVVPSNYPPPPHKAALARLLGYVQYAAIAAAICAERVLPLLGYPVTLELAQSIKDKRFGVIVGTWFLGNMLVNSLTSTGAFEVFYDGHQVYSKLKTGQLPTTQELFTGIERLMAPTH